MRRRGLQLALFATAHFLVCITAIGLVMRDYDLAGFPDDYPFESQEAPPLSQSAAEQVATILLVPTRWIAPRLSWPLVVVNSLIWGTVMMLGVTGTTWVFRKRSTAGKDNA